MSLKDLLQDALVARGTVLAKPSPIPCKGYQINTPDQYDYDCEYAYAGTVTCDDCIVNGGKYDPRTGKKYYTRKKTK
jgi:hypothetical protein